jgi:glycosyltransferase involved in cell wall biosynthesis
MLSKKRILVIHPDLRASGGGNVVAAYIIDALRREHSVSTLSWAPANIDALNHFFGTSLSASELTVRSAPLLLRVVAKLNPWLVPFRYAILLRMCRKMRNDYDVIISVNNEADFGCRGIQYIHDPPYWFCAVHGRPRLSFYMLFPHHLWAVFKGEYRPWMVIAGFSYNRMKNNLTLVNSHWTGRKISEFYEMKCITVYPPVPGFFPISPWEERENGFVCIGTISPWKRLENLIKIIGAVRLEFKDAHLHIIGTTEDRRYRKRLLNLMKGSSWIFLNGNVSREELVRLVARHRYGIHGMKNEPFGIAVAEMVRGGCIVFVPRSGGPMEIVGGDDCLLYDTNEEAVTKILRVMKNRDEQISLRRHLDSRKHLFSTDKFIYYIQHIIRQFSKELSTTDKI